MKILPAISELRLPSFLKKTGLKRLANATAAAFGRPALSFKGLSLEESLREYARFSREAAEQAFLNKEGLPGIEARLYRETYRLGWWLRQLLHITTLEEAMALGRILYRALEIDFEGDSTGEITIRRCFFSSYYSPEICAAISALDHGILAGLAGGGDLQFYRRITAGDKYCKACLQLKEKS